MSSLDDYLGIRVDWPAVTLDVGYGGPAVRVCLYDSERSGDVRLYANIAHSGDVPDDRAAWAWGRVTAVMRPTDLVDLVSACASAHAAGTKAALQRQLRSLLGATQQH